MTHAHRFRVWALAVTIPLLACLFGHPASLPAQSGPATAPLTAFTAPLSIGKPLRRVVGADVKPAAPSPWANAHVLSEERERFGVGGLRVQVLSDPGSHFPVRIEELLERTPDGREVVVGRMEMAAGHLLARLQAGVNSSAVLNASPD